ncbi:MAG: lamin tail domain-containing protein [Patescibacteria group bacterium]
MIRSSILTKSSLFLLVLLLVVPHSVSAAVLFNEIAWMGSKESQFAEWIELYNSGDAEVDLSGASLFEEGGAVSVFVLSKKITPGGYLLLERTTASSPDPVPGISDESGAWGGGGLSNSGEYLVLKDRTGAVLDTIDAKGGWPAGDNATKETMQKNGSGWITATSTPKAKNAEPQTLPPVVSAVASTTAAAGASAAPSSHSSSITLSDEVPEYDFTVSAGRDRLVTRGTPVTFEARTRGTIPSTIEYRWSFGDGSSSLGKKVTKIYGFPGEYAVVLNAVAGDTSAVARAAVKVAPLAVSIFTDPRDSRIELANTSPYEVNLGNWTIELPTQSFVFPQDTIVLPRSMVTLPRSITRLSLSASTTAVLRSPDASIVIGGEGGGSAAPSLESAFNIQSLLDRVAALAEALATLRREILTLRK